MHSEVVAENQIVGGQPSPSHPILSLLLLHQQQRQEKRVLCVSTFFALFPYSSFWIELQHDTPSVVAVVNFCCGKYFCWFHRLRNVVSSNKGIFLIDDDQEAGIASKTDGG